MALDPEQRKIAAYIIRRGKQRGESPMEILAAIETGLVESNLRNLAGGDADSQGWRQERKSLYPNPRNLQASVDRFFDETSAVQGKYKDAGSLAAAVQRPAAQYRGRYGERRGEALKIIEELGGKDIPLSDLGSTPSANGTSRQSSGGDRLDKLMDTLERMNAIVSEPISTFGAQTDEDKTSSFEDNMQFLRQIADMRKARQQPEMPTSTGSRTPPRGPQGGGGVRGDGIGGRLLESFYNVPGAINVDEGKKVGMGFVPGHKEHWHVAAGPRSIKSIARLAQEAGLQVRELEGFDPVDPVHTQGSYHYKNRAADISGDPEKLKRLNRRIASMYGIR